ncbi:MAG: proline hydroxylase [Leptolyngbyaceae cyanobacterium RU_5_1]|nr:proline hydroxylase [Leptolyngbyaceae cyanobacterium RU_5_1]
MTSIELFTFWNKVNRLEHDNVVISSAYVQIDNFLSTAEANQLLNMAVLKEPLFEPAQAKTEYLIANNVMLLRRHQFPEVVEWLSDRIHCILPTVMAQLKVADFAITRTEMQLIASQDGAYFQRHLDQHPHDSRKTRKLSYIYYLHQQPKPFSGGELLLYDSKIAAGCYETAESFKAIAPRHNSIVFFHSRNAHEVKPVSCPSKQFKDSRFAINGWIHR